MGMRQAMDVQEPQTVADVVELSGQEDRAREKQAFPDQLQLPYLVPPLARTDPCAPRTRSCDGWAFVIREGPKWMCWSGWVRDGLDERQGAPQDWGGGQSWTCIVIRMP